ncbi:hypothetical protein N7494_004371 [Penicillium frequentans]|uniref:Uncharacterized protein n=1 Tax=Penicillium frequentans TaxID=3151616 RepID=A0AAD6D0H8_9EURO|nr:hypothetical protein N7494_004371 [Penicillium glabrum]
MATTDPPPPYQPFGPSTPAATPAPIATFRIECPMQRDYYVYTSPNKDDYLKVQAHISGTKCDLAFYRSNAPHHKLISCDLKETTASVDKASLRTSTGEMDTIWWAANLDPKIPISVQYRFRAKLRDPMDPFAFISGPVNSVRSHPFYWQGGSDWKLVHEATGNVAAIVRDVDLTARKYGSIEILMSYGDTFSIIVLSSYMAICERLKRGG